MFNQQISLIFPTKTTFAFSVTAACFMPTNPVSISADVFGKKQTEIPKYVKIGHLPVVATRSVKRGGVRHIDLFTACDIHGMSREERRGLKKVRPELYPKIARSRRKAK